MLFSQDAKPDAYQDSLQKLLDKNPKQANEKEVLFLLGEHLVQRDLYGDYPDTLRPPQ